MRRAMVPGNFSLFAQDQPADTEMRNGDIKFWITAIMIQRTINFTNEN